MINEPTLEELERLPSYQATRDIPPEEKPIHMHFGLFSLNWYVAAYDSRKREIFAYGSYDLGKEAWGRWSYDGIRDLRVRKAAVLRDAEWNVKTINDLLSERKYLPDFVKKNGRNELLALMRRMEISEFRQRLQSKDPSALPKGVSFYDIQAAILLGDLVLKLSQ